MRGQQQMSTIVVFVLIVLVLALSVGLAILFKDVIWQTTNSVDCAAQVKAHAVIVRTSNELKAPDIKCPTQRVIVKGEDEAKKEIAQQMKTCWDMWGKGQMQLFGEQEGIYCHICGTVRVEDAPAVRGLPAYLQAHNASKNMSYATYLTGQKSGTYYTETQFQQAAQASIATDKPIGVIFYYVKGNEWYKQMWNSINRPGTSTAVGTVGGAYVAGGIVSALPLSLGPQVIVVLAGATAGAATGLIASVYGRATNSYMAAVVVRPLSEQDVKELGCQYAFAES
jgi:hypothetical protein